MNGLHLGALAFLTMAGSAMAQEALYLDTALRDGYEIKSQSTVVFTRLTEGAETYFTRTEVIVQKGAEFALCPIETDIEKNASTERRCAVFE